jgi:hypothetical protein
MTYAGLLPVFFAGYAAWRRRDARGVGIWLVMTVLGLGAMYALPVFNAVNYLPVIGLANNGRLRLLFRFALIIAAAFGFDRLVADLAERRPGWARFIGAYGAVVLLLPALTYAALRQWSSIRAPAPLSMLVNEVGVVIILLALAGLVVLRARGTLGATPFRALLVALAFADPLWHFGNFNPPIPTAHVFPETPLVRFLKNDRSVYRVSSGTLTRVMTPDSKLPYRLYDVDLFDVLNVQRYTYLQEAVNKRVHVNFNTLRAFDFREPGKHGGLISLMNVKYVLLPAADFAPDDPFRAMPRFRLVYDREVRAYENLDVMPRAFLVDRAAVVSTDEALAAITRADFDPRTAAVLLEDPSSPQLPASPGGSPGATELTALSANRVVVRVNATRASYLVLADTNYPGWQARLDGARTPIYQAHYLFRAVYVPAGEHEVAFAFMPTSYRLAMAGSLACLVLVAGCFAWDGFARGRGQHGAA